jgi:vancomycin resistance protein VanW
MGAMTIPRRLARRVLPLGLRQALAHARRAVRDRVAGVRFGRMRGGGGWPAWVEIAQPVMPSATLEAKLANLRLGASRIDGSMVEAGGCWSFWDRVGRPSARRGFARGRNLVDGRLVIQTGGGLCQLSGLIHHLALSSGLEVSERHAHSIDIYREDERFTPLGADATVVWGVKDLRLRNPHPFPVAITCAVEGDRVVARLRSELPIAERTVDFVREPAAAGRVRVWTVIGGVRAVETEYERREGLRLA